MCVLVRDFLQEKDFMERNLRQRGSKQLRKKMHHVGSADQANSTHRTCFLPVKLSSLRGARSKPEHSSPGNPAPANTLEQPQWKRRRFSRLQRGARSTLEQIPLCEILLLEEIPG
jgi:hypothetical protein